MKKLRILLSLLGILGVGFCLASCDWRKVERAQEKIEEGVEKAGDKIEDAGDKIQEKTDRDGIRP